MMRKCQVRFLGEEDTATCSSLPDNLQQPLLDKLSKAHQLHLLLDNSTLSLMCVVWMLFVYKPLKRYKLPFGN